jgi:hypothetical protein
MLCAPLIEHLAEQTFKKISAVSDFSSSLSFVTNTTPQPARRQGNPKPAEIGIFIRAAPTEGSRRPANRKSQTGSEGWEWTPRFN